MVIDLFLLYQFIKRLATPFKEWDAYELGIIDAKGKQLKKRKDFRKQKEHDAFGLFDLMVTKLKRLLEKVPGGSTRLGSYAAALWLIKENHRIEEAEMITEEEIEQELKRYMVLAEDYDINKMFESIVDEDIANVVGNVAGTGGEAGEPGLTPKQMKKYKKKNKDGMPLKRFATYR
tara:strand:+ start:478 stop:1005 length:528 start_codon:yes stop_codon:yes gene_type:complete